MLKETQRNRPRHTQRDTCRNMCIPEDTPRKRYPQKDGVRGGQESQSDRDMQRCTDGDRKELQGRDKERDREKEICRDMHRQRGRDITV